MSADPGGFRRAELEPEVAAFFDDDTTGERSLIVVNTEQPHENAVNAVRVILHKAFLGWLPALHALAEPVRRVTSEQTMAVACGVIVASAGGAAAVIGAETYAPPRAGPAVAAPPTLVYQQRVTIARLTPTPRPPRPVASTRPVAPTYASDDEDAPAPVTSETRRPLVSATATPPPTPRPSSTSSKSAPPEPRPTPTLGPAPTSTPSTGAPTVDAPAAEPTSPKPGGPKVGGPKPGESKPGESKPGGPKVGATLGPIKVEIKVPLDLGAVVGSVTSPR